MRQKVSALVFVLGAIFSTVASVGVSLGVDGSYTISKYEGVSFFGGGDLLDLGVDSRHNLYISPRLAFSVSDVVDLSLSFGLGYQKLESYFLGEKDPEFIWGLGASIERYLLRGDMFNLSTGGKVDWRRFRNPLDVDFEISHGLLMIGVPLNMDIYTSESFGFRFSTNITSYRVNYIIIEDEKIADREFTLLGDNLKLSLGVIFRLR